MRTIFAAILILVPTLAYAQQGKPSETDQSSRIENPITKAQILALPRTNWKPKVTLQQALKLAERYIKKMRLDISSGYLFEARLVNEDLDKSHWQFWWVKSGNDIKITVSMDGIPQMLSSP